MSEFRTQMRHTVTMNHLQALPVELILHVALYIETGDDMVNLIRAFGSDANFKDLLPILDLVDIFGISPSNTWPILTVYGDFAEFNHEMISAVSHLYKKVCVTYQHALKFEYYQFMKIIGSKRTEFQLVFIHSAFQQEDIFELVVTLKLCRITALTIFDSELAHEGHLGLQLLSLGLKGSYLTSLSIISSLCQEGCLIITQGLADSKIEHLNLKSNVISDRLLLDLITALNESDAKTLDVSDNFVSNKVFDGLEPVLRGSCLELIDLKGNLLDAEGCSMMLGMCDKNGIKLVVDNQAYDTLMEGSEGSDEECIILIMKGVMGSVMMR